MDVECGNEKVESTESTEMLNDNRTCSKDEKCFGDYSTLIAILLLSGVLLCIIIGFTMYATCKRRSYRKKRHQLTEELHTVENGYHDNPTLEVMEVQPEMQEKANLNSDDGNIVPTDSLTKEKLEGEADTHL
ncbi:hypothetical protein EOD39_3977 [Acipenser ruthenus]|uniref:Podocalyxin n=1 Tax=Acipenser ruthenus TaxID=7906 RepID=A0A444UKF9_ACIRT|nr:hypothetical protein EOD39_3977 [Acipenser ruthenus]